MNHPLVRRKFGATFFFFPSSRGRGTAIGSWKTWKGVAVWRYTYGTVLSTLSARFQIFLDSFFLSLLLHEPDFSFFIYLVLFSFTFLLRLYVFLPLRAVFPDVSVFFLSFVSTATHFSVVLFPSSLAPSFHLAPRSGWELKWI